MSWAYFLLWPVACPALYLLLLLRARKAIVRRQQTALADSTRFLWREYRDAWMLWEVLDMLRKLFLDGFVLFIPVELPMGRLFFALLLWIQGIHGDSTIKDNKDRLGKGKGKGKAKKDNIN